MIPVKDMLAMAIQAGASDVHINISLPPVMRINTELIVMDLPEVTNEDAIAMIVEMVGEAKYKKFEEKRDLDQRDAGKDKARAVAVEQAADSQLRHRGDCEDNEREPADQRRALADSAETLLEDLRQGESLALEDDAGDGGREEDDRGDADQHGATFSR